MERASVKGMSRPLSGACRDCGTTFAFSQTCDGQVELRIDGPRCGSCMPPSRGSSQAEDLVADAGRSDIGDGGSSPYVAEVEWRTDGHTRVFAVSVHHIEAPSGRVGLSATPP